MMLPKTFVLATLLAAVSASPCKPSSSSMTASPTSSDPPTSTSTNMPVTPTLPSTGAADLPAPDTGLTLLKIAVGHGLQNYTCANTSSTAALQGALAVLYDVTPLYPGMPGSLSAEAFNGLSSTVLWSQDIPLNLVNTTAADPGSPNAPNALAEASYGADINNPFIAPADLELPNMAPIPFLGRHYFDAAGSPTFDLMAANLLASVGKKGNVPAPSTADRGVLNTGAVDWLYLPDNAKGISRGVSLVYRVITAGGNAEACSVSGAGAGSVPYTAFYWFFGQAPAV